MGDGVWGREPTERCGVCHSEHVWSHIRSINIIHCRSCGSAQARFRHTTTVYNAEYIKERYDRYPTTTQMSRLRMHVLQSALFLFDNDVDAWGYQGTRPSGPQARILDVGYGNGSFIREARSLGWWAFGNDINPTSYPHVERVELPINPRLGEIERYRVITFFDSLEHFETLEHVRHVSRNTDWIFLSFPCMPPGWFLDPRSWKHYRPGEHHWYFNPAALQTLFSNEEVNACLVWAGHPEDTIRGKLAGGEPNITTCAIRCWHNRKDLKYAN